MLLREIMTESVVTASPATPVRRVAELMRDRNVGSVVLVDDSGRPVGMVTDRDLTIDARQRPQMYRELEPDHGNVWTSTDSTAGRSRTIGAQWSPASADAYTCPPVVPKYTPHESSESTAIASRNTLT